MNKLKLIYYSYKRYILIKKLIAYKTRLKYKWVLWFHNVNTSDWSLNSYQKIYKINNIIDFWRVYNNHYKLNNGMYFLMKDNIKPIYESEENKNGGYWSLKIYNNVYNTWLDLSLDLIGNILDKYDIVNGISISCKNKFYIIKIWLNNSKYNSINDININKSLYKYNILFNKYK